LLLVEGARLHACISAVPELQREDQDIIGLATGAGLGQLVSSENAQSRADSARCSASQVEAAPASCRSVAVNGGTNSPPLHEAAPLGKSQRRKVEDLRFDSNRVPSGSSHSAGWPLGEPPGARSSARPQPGAQRTEWRAGKEEGDSTEGVRELRHRRRLERCVALRRALRCGCSEDVGMMASRGTGALSHTLTRPFWYQRHGAAAYARNVLEIQRCSCAALARALQGFVCLRLCRRSTDV
jgi:hypothetical protein